MSGEDAFIILHCYVDLRFERQSIGFGRVGNAHCPTLGLRSLEIDARVGVRVSALLVEYKVTGLQVNRILQLFREYFDPARLLRQD